MGIVDLCFGDINTQKSEYVQKKKKSQEKLQKTLELGLKGKLNRERLPSLLLDLSVEFSLSSGLNFGVCECEDVHTGSMCPKSLGYNGGTQGTWGCFFRELAM